jgi:hypothetical protein
MFNSVTTECINMLRKVSLFVISDCFAHLCILLRFIIDFDSLGPKVFDVEIVSCVFLLGALLIIMFMNLTSQNSREIRSDDAILSSTSVSPSIS